jgi:nitrogen fixation NifU-like protein
MHMDEQVEKKYVLDMIGKYSETVIDHARNPRNVGNIPKADGFAQEVGECGDTLAIWLSVKDNRIDKATFWTDGCGSSIACGSMVTEIATNRTVEEALKIKPEDILDELADCRRIMSTVPFWLPIL